MPFHAGLFRKIKSTFTEDEDEKKRRERLFGIIGRKSLEFGAGVQKLIPPKTQEAAQSLISTITEPLTQEPELSPGRLLKDTSRSARAALNLLAIPISALEESVTAGVKKTPLRDVKVKVPGTEFEFAAPEALGFAAALAVPVPGGKKAQVGRSLLKQIGQRLGMSEKEVFRKAEQGSDAFFKSIRRQLQKSGVKLETAPASPPDQVIKAFEEIKTSISGLHKFKPNEVADVVKDSKKVNKAVANLFRKGLLNVDDLPTFRKWGYANEDAARFIEEFATFGGKDLNRISQWERNLSKIIPEELATTLNPQTAGWSDLFLNRLPITTINLWRASLVSQMATAARNFEVATGFFGLRMVEDALVASAQTVMRKVPPKQAFAPVWEDMMVLFNKVSPSKRRLIAEVVDQNPLIKGKLYATPVMDVAVTNKVAKVISIFNRTQEFAARGMFFEATLRGKLGKLGLKLEELAPTQIDPKLLAESADEALRLTFAQNPSNAFAKEMVRASNKMPTAVLNMLIYPFPRFLSNAVKASFDFSPGGYLRFLSPKNAKALAKGDEAALKIAAKATIGTGMFVTASYVRNSKYAGEKWFELKVPEDQVVPEVLQKIGIKPGSTIDMRPFGPVFPTYMFLAELVKDEGVNFGPKDWIEGMLGINRIAGTTLYITSMLSGQDDWQGLKKASKEFLGQILGGFGTPAVTIRDFLGQVSQPERVARSTKETPILGPFIEKLPFARRLLPESPSLTRGEPFEREATLLRQLTGISIKNKNKLESELDKLDIRFSEIAPRTGDRFIDRLIMGKVGPVMEELIPIIDSSEYESLSKDNKEEIIKELFSKVKKEAKKVTLIENAPEIATRFFEDLTRAGTAEKQKEVLEKWANKNLINEVILALILNFKKLGLTPEEAFKKLGNFSPPRESPFEIFGRRVP